MGGRSSMRLRLQTAARRLRRIEKALAGIVLGQLVVWSLKGLRRFDPDRTSDFASRCMRALGPLLPEHRLGRANLTAAFPEKSPAEIEAILRGVWENLGRTGAEFPHLDRLWDYDPAGPTTKRVEFAHESLERFVRLRDDGKPALIFAAHLGNWELPALAAASHGLDAAILYRRPNIAQVDRAVGEIRSVNMDFFYGSSFVREQPEAYERLLLDCMIGDSTLFTRRDEVEAAWIFIQGILDEWKIEPRETIQIYESGSWGPQAADEFIWRDGRRWRRP